MAINTNSDGVWKWVAALLLAVMLAGAPGIVQAIRAPSKDQVELIQERQQVVLQRLAAQETQIEFLILSLARFEELAKQQEQRLETHIENHGR